MWSVFLNHYFNGDTKTWIKELIYYHGDYSEGGNADLQYLIHKNDWRFKEIHKKRDRLTFIKLTANG